MVNSAIRKVRGRQVLDSRGRPTVECDIELADGSCGRASVPSGASTGAAEACELRDGDLQRYAGRGVLKAVANVNGEIASLLHGKDACDQRRIDGEMRALDGTAALARLGGNAILAASLAVSRAAASSLRLPLYAHIARLAGTAGPTLPLPMVNILSGGMHAGWGMDIQDFLAIPARAASFSEALHTMACVRAAAADEVAQRGAVPLLADEGGLSPGCRSPEEALEIMTKSIERAGLRPGQDVLIAIDVAASALRGEAGAYRFAAGGFLCSSIEMIEMMERWTRRFPVASIEDGLGEEDWEGWQTLTGRLGGTTQLVGDDLFTTDPMRLDRGIRLGAANALLVKPNQNGTLSGVLEVIARARAHGYASIVSARSGETEDAYIADLAVGSAAGQIKIGSLRTSNTVAKYNQLLRIEEESGVPFAGAAALRR